MQDQDRQQISVSELPDAVTAKLESQDYSGWTVGNAYKKMDESNQEIYIVELKQGTETKKVKFDRDGNQLEKDKHGKSESSQYRDDAQSEETQLEDTQSSDQSSETQSTEQSTEQTDNSSTEQQ
ncbi:MAG TPA: hypothetical protein VFT90_15620 [Chryseosolibacter sp.]|nr:hypothetical protein [Chryseosolibacter sp.]